MDVTTYLKTGERGGPEECQNNAGRFRGPTPVLTGLEEEVVEGGVVL